MKDCGAKGARIMLSRVGQAVGVDLQVGGKDAPSAGLAGLTRWWPVMPKGKGWIHVMRRGSVGVYLAVVLYCSGWVMACPVREEVGQRTLRYSDGLAISRFGELWLDIDVEQPLPLAGVPAPGSAEHDLWVPALDVAQIRERLRQGGKGVLPGASPWEQQWQKLLSEHLRQMGVTSPEEQKRWVELLQMDEERWRRFLEGIQRRLSQEGKEVPPLPPRNWFPPLNPSKLMQPPPLSTDSPFVSPDRSPVAPPQSVPPTPQGQDQPLPSPQDPRQRSWDAFRELWERYIGPLDNTPELRNLLQQMVGDGGMAWDLRDSSGRSVWEVLREQMPEVGRGRGQSGDDRGEGASAEGGTEGRRWRWPQWRWPRWSLSLRWGRPGSGGGSWGSLSSSGWDWPVLPRSSWWFLAILAVVGVATAALIIRQRRRFAGLSWPHLSPQLRGQQLVDPRQIRTPEELVRAFEWWSVQLLGPEARHWTHATIARALHQKAILQKEQIDELAHLYELARYAPEARKLPPEVWMQGRHLLCLWAGVSPP